MEKYKICLIVPYFGQFPSFFNLFLSSCAFNPSINWLIFTDNIISAPKNVKVINIQFSDFKDFVQKKFDFPISLEKPYKLCDYKPCYGYIFDEYLKDFDFWGHCDIDLIWGNIRKFLTEEILDEYNKIFDMGHLSLYRNTENVNCWFMKLPPIDTEHTYRKILSSNESFIFDEYGGRQPAWGGIHRMLQNEGIPFYTKTFCDDINPDKFLFSSRRIYLNNKLPPNRSLYFLFDHGKLLQCIKTKKGVNHTESMYVHLQKRIMKVENEIDLSSFYIVPNSFIAGNTDIINIWNLSSHKKMIYYDYLRRRFRNLINKIKKHK